MVWVLFGSIYFPFPLIVRDITQCNELGSLGHKQRLQQCQGLDIEWAANNVLQRPARHFKMFTVCCVTWAWMLAVTFGLPESS